MNQITKEYTQLLKASGLNYSEFVKTITNEEHKMYIQWNLLKKYAKKAGK